MAFTYQRSKKSKSMSINDILYARVFFKPSQGVVGIRRVKTPNWRNGLPVLEVLRAEFAVKSPAALCIGRKGRDFYSCLKDKASGLGYANKNGVLYAVDQLLSKNKHSQAWEALDNHLIKMKAPFTAMQNARRFVKILVNSGETIDVKAVKDTITKYLYIDAPLFNKKEVEKYANINSNINEYKTHLEKFVDTIPQEMSWVAEQFTSGRWSDLVSEEEKTRFSAIETIIAKNQTEIIDAIVSAIRSVVKEDNSLI